MKTLLATAFIIAATVTGATAAETTAVTAETVKCTDATGATQMLSKEDCSKAGGKVEATAPAKHKQHMAKKHMAMTPKK